jgi:carotenoid cleavage dioxygenase-like enzyme
VAKTGSAEGEGYAMSVVSRLDGRDSDLVFLDAQHFNDGPVATVKFPFRLRMALHGSWSPAASL